MSESPIVRTIAALTHGRYLLAGADGERGRPLLVGCHGYGENATAHLEALRRIPGSERWLLCAVEALHPFYNTKTGDVIGCWMTRRDREQAIDDNVRYVAGVVAAVRRELAASHVLVFAGFSQGVAMAYRAALRCGFPCRGLIALAGDVPPELADAGQHPFPATLIGRGDRDSWYTQEKLEKDLGTLAQRGADVESCVFAGGHEWSEPFLAAAGAFLRRIAEAP